MDSSDSAPVVLLAPLGYNPYNPQIYDDTRYRFSDADQYPARFAPLATWRWLLGQGTAPDRVLLLLSGDARKSVPAFLDDAGALDLDCGIVGSVEVPVPESEASSWELVRRIELALEDAHGGHAGSAGDSSGKMTAGGPSEAAPGRSGAVAACGEGTARPANVASDGEDVVRHRVFLDLTHGFRALPLALVFAAQLLEDAGLIVVEGLFYGAFQRGRDETPMLRLDPLRDVARWARAMRRHQREGDDRVLAELLGDRARLVAKAAALRREPIPQAARNLATQTVKALPSLRARLPVEAGLELQPLRNVRLSAIREELRELPRSLQAAFVRSFQSVARLACQKGFRGKRRLWLDKKELWRQLECARVLAGMQLIPVMSQVLREWCVTRTILAANGDAPVAPKEWLSRDARIAKERILNSLVEPDEGGVSWGDRLGPGHRAVGNLWRNLCNLRNSIAHCGMTLERVKHHSVLEQATKLLEQAADLGSDPESWRLPVQDSRRVVLAPAGLSPGAVYNAARGGEADILVFLASAETKEMAWRAAERAGLARDLVHELLVLDPFHAHRPGHLRGFWQALFPLLQPGDQLRCCLTGGTTAMGLAVTRLGEHAQRLGLEVRRFLVLDDRSPEVKRSDPFVDCSIEWLEPQGSEPG